MKRKPDLSIIILNFNTKDLLRDCLFSIGKVKTNHFQFEVIVVDNGSTDSSVKSVKELFINELKKKKNQLVNSLTRNKIIVNKVNLGFAKGNNVGVHQAKGRYILFLNPDTIVFPETLTSMVKFMDDHPHAGAATCRVELADGRLDDACHRGFPTPWNAFCHFSSLGKIFPKSRFFAGYSLGWLPLNKTHEIDSGVGAFLIIRRETGEQVGWWDEDYFWYGEDLDFCYRIKEKGWRIFYVPKVKIIHYKGASSGLKKHSQKISTATKKTKIRSVEASTQVMRIFYQKHYLDKYPKIVGLLVMRGIDLLEKIRIARAQ